MHDKFCKELGNVHYGAELVEENIDSEQDDSVAVKTRTFWEKEEDVGLNTFCKPIRTPRQNSFFGSDAYNSHPKQELDK